MKHHIQRIVAIGIVSTLLVACEVSEPGRATPVPLPTQASQPAGPTSVQIIPPSDNTIPPTDGPYVPPYPAP